VSTDGLVIVDKPGGCTSHDVVGRVRRLARTRKVGHAGTLDPMATGVLVVGVGKATRLLHHLVLADKAYTATIRLGRATTTDDAEGDVLTSATAGHLNEDNVRAEMANFVGTIEQVPSSVSAIKVDGKRAYDLARAGQSVPLPARPITVRRFHAFDFRAVEECLDVDVEVDCSSGTYVRALARDLGAALGVGGHLTALRRTRVGPFALDLAHTLDELAELADPVTLSLASAVRQALPVRIVDAPEAAALSYGKALAPHGITGTHGALTPDGTVVALLQEREGLARPVLVFTPAG
jgi:tRNA pseudouridine55 synthase